MLDKLQFTHLHVHTQYSLLDSSSKIRELILRTKELGMDSIAITDHGVMYGIIDFYKTAKENGIKPILGCEVYVSSGSRFNKESSPDNFYYHLVLLAENEEGYKNLIKLVSYGFIEGFYYKPRIDIELLKRYHKGIIALSACLSGPISKNLLNHSYEKAKEFAVMYNNIFGDGNFYIEIQDHGMEVQKRINQQLIKMSGETGIPLVCTNDSHYIMREDAQAHDILLCIQTNKTINDENRMRYEGSEFYLKSPEEMHSLFYYVKEALENTNKIAQRCNVDFEFNKYKLPVFTVPENKTAFEYLKELCYSGLKLRYKDITPNIEHRLNYELDVINQMGFVDYFLIVWDFIKYAKDNDIIVGPGRGSAAGSIVSYVLQITDIDPIQYNLIFERFLNPERISMPDIDIDFCYERRQEVIDYVIKKYGADHVSQIITFGTMAARNAIRDVGRVLAMPYNEVDKIAKMIPIDPKIKITISKSLEMNYQLKREYDSDENIKYLIDMSMKLEGLPRHASTHAAGVVICDKPVIEYVPLNSNDGVITTQFTMTTIEELGLLKMDFLGLRTLTVIQNAFKEMSRNRKNNINISYNDSKVFELISSGNTEGIFQLESSGMKQFIKELKPQNIEDIIAGIALYRPGPMEFIPQYIKVKNNPESIKYLHPLLEPILKPTYGCIIYQEQVMQIVRELAGYSLGRSDMVRRAMSKKKTDVMIQERKNFIYGCDGVPGCIENGISEKIANKIFDDMVDFAKYAFNRSHAAAYAVVAYQTAWLKTYYPVEFMAALMTSVMDNTEKIAEYIETCKKMNIDVLPPDVNKGYSGFSVLNGKILFGLSAIKNVGKGNIEALVNEREKNHEYSSLSQFLERLNGKFNTRCIESLIKAGAFDSLGGFRSQYMEVYKDIYTSISNNKKKNIEGQISLFSILKKDKNFEADKDDLPDIPEYETNKKLSFEKEVLGIYVSDHPLSKYKETLDKFTSATSLDFNSQEVNEFGVVQHKIFDRQPVAIGGIISSVSIKYTKNNKTMAFITLEDLHGTIEVVIFPNVYSTFSSVLIEDEIVIVNGNASISEEQPPKVICQKITSYNQLNKLNRTLWLKIPKNSNLSIKNLIDVLSENKGKTPVKVFDEATNQRLYINSNNWVNVNNEFILKLKNILGEKCVVLKENK